MLASYGHTQVTIGLGEPAEEGSLLQLKSIPEVKDGGVNATKGLLLSRVLLTKKKELFPMFGSQGSVTNDYDTDKAGLDKIHVGMMVYNLTDDAEEDLCPGVHFWSGIEWIRMPAPCLCRFTATGEDAKKYMYACEDYTLIKHSEALTKCDELGEGWHLMKFSEFDQIFASNNNKGDQAFASNTWYWVDMEDASQWEASENCGYKAIPMNVIETNDQKLMRDTPYYGSREAGGTAEYVNTDDPNMDICANGIGTIGEPRVNVRCVRGISSN